MAEKKKTEHATCSEGPVGEPDHYDIDTLSPTCYRAVIVDDADNWQELSRHKTFGAADKSGKKFFRGIGRE